jgi:hypothetical protein
VLSSHLKNLWRQVPFHCKIVVEIKMQQFLWCHFDICFTISIATLLSYFKIILKRLFEHNGQCNVYYNACFNIIRPPFLSY